MTIAISGAVCRCSFGGVCPINILPTTNVFVSGQLCVRSPDAKMLNIPTFEMCYSPANPNVKKTPVGAVIPAICTPSITNPTWITKKTNVKICKQCVCSMDDKCFCLYGGIISIIVPGQTSVS